MEMTATDRINRDTTPWRPAENAAKDAHRAGNREEPPAGRTTAVEWSDLVAGTPADRHRLSLLVAKRRSCLGHASLGAVGFLLG
ncbi:hypothetical protein MTX20_12730 [Bradyrhizobium sp. ISRA435]|nr:hypothetical protein MTX20_12730 [Bradyrhizobium sp. ISRA435]